MTSMDSERGVLYITIGKQYLDACIRSAQSVKKHCKDLPVHVFTDESVTGNDCFDSVDLIVNPNRWSGIGCKVEYMGRSPFQKTLFLDADTEVCADVTDLFNVLDRFDIALSHAHHRVAGSRRVWQTPVPYGFAGFNSGVILFKKSGPVRELLDDWKQAFHNAGFKNDQITLRELIWMSNLRVATLPPEYNIRNRKYLSIWSAKDATPKILHYGSFKQEKNTMIRQLRTRVRSAVLSRL